MAKNNKCANLIGNLADNVNFRNPINEDIGKPM